MLSKFLLYRLVPLQLVWKSLVHPYLDEAWLYIRIFEPDSSLDFRDLQTNVQIELQSVSYAEAVVVGSSEINVLKIAHALHLTGRDRFT